VVLNGTQADINEVEGLTVSKQKQTNKTQNYGKVTHKPYSHGVKYSETPLNDLNDSRR